MSDTDMTTVADAIRSKTGGSDPLSFPTGFSEAIEGISGGGETAEVSPLMSQAFNNLVAIPSEITGDMWPTAEAITNDVYIVNWSPQPYVCNYIQASSVELPRGEVYRIPSGLDGAGTIRISKGMFCGLRGVYIRGDVTSNYSTVTGEGEIYDLAGNGANLFESANLREYPRFNTRRSETGEYMFSKTTFLNDIEIPEGITVIGRYSFSSASISTGNNPEAENKVTIPATVTEIKSYAFQSFSTGATFVLKPTTPPTLGYGGFSASYVSKIIVPVGTLDAYKTATNWTTLAEKMEEATE